MTFYMVPACIVIIARCQRKKIGIYIEAKCKDIKAGKLSVTAASPWQGSFLFENSRD